jgi:pilus assembly protein CpaF
MDVSDFKHMLRKETRYLTDGWDGTNRVYLETRVREYLDGWLRTRAVEIDPEDEALVIKQLCDDFGGFGPIHDLLADPHVTEIMINGPRNIYVEKDGHAVHVPIAFDDDKHLDYVIAHMIAPSGRRLDPSSPCADFSLADGTRVNVTIPPLSVGGTSVTIRKLIRSIDSLNTLVDLGTLDARMANFLVNCLRGRVNILFSGATGTGKTTTINILSRYMSADERVITIEDALELSLLHGNLVRLLTRPPDIHGKGEISLRFLFTNALRMRPSRLILGEIRGSEAMDYIQAVNTGHAGTLAVIHASRPRDAVTRLETLALYAGLDLPVWVIRKQIASGLQLIVQHAQLPDGSRKITQIAELVGMDKDEIILKDIFRYEVEDTDKDTELRGAFVAVEPPTFLSSLRKRGIHMDEALFRN